MSERYNNYLYFDNHDDNCVLNISAPTSHNSFNKCHTGNYKYK